MNNLEKIKELIFETDNNACFIERERILARLEKDFAGYAGEDKYALILSKLLSEVSVPIFDCDYFAGRVIEALPDEGMSAPSRLIFSEGHMSFDYEKVLKLGLRGILEEIKENAAAKGDEASLSFAKNAEIVIGAIRDFALRYAEEAEIKGRADMAKALRCVPFEPAYDFYSALQGIWIIHMIASCYVGARDYAFGRFDNYMLPFYEKALADGKKEEELCELLAGFLVKTNEICGRGTHNYKTKPILCQASKQYVNIGGEKPNAFSSLVLDAAMLSNMPQPQIVVLLSPEADHEFTDKTFKALSVLTDKMNIYNFDLVFSALTEMGYPENIAKDFTYSACCTFDLNYHTYRLEYYAQTPQRFIAALDEEAESLEEVVSNFKAKLKENLSEFLNKRQQGFDAEESRKRFVLDGLFLSDSAKECRYACDGKAKYNVINVFLPAAATIGDSLMAIDKLVFREKRYSFSEFIDIVRSDFEGNEELRQEILSYPKFGNDTEADEYTVLAAEAMLESVGEIPLKENYRAIPGFYSLERENVWSPDLAATPDGRRAGSPVSENQSPTYGADKNGITALLKSISKLPLRRTVTGGLNLTFSKNVSPEILKALVVSYFEMGGLHVGISVINRETLLDAMKTPEKYKSLTVRLYGFSEYFISLPEWQQLAVLGRTEYNTAE